MATARPATHPNHRITKPSHKKLARLPPDAHISKRPLLRPAIPSPHSGPSQPKIIYISTRTAFLPVIKRVEKLLALAEKREVQSATTLVGQRQQKGRGKQGRGNDDILAIAEVVESRKQNASRGGGEIGGEEVVLKGTGKAVQKCLEFGLWFQQRPERFGVSLRTGSVGAIDDIEVDEEAPVGDVEPAGEADVEEDGASDGGGGVEVEPMDVESQPLVAAASTDPTKQTVGERSSTTATATSKADPELIPESRIRYTSSLEVSIRRR